MVATIGSAGGKHPDALETLKHLAVTKALANDLAGGRSLLERVLVDQEDVLGPDHPSTRDTRDSLSFVNTLMESGPDTAISARASVPGDEAGG